MSFVAGAVVVRVPSLFSFSYDAATAVAATDGAGVGEVVAYFAVFAREPRVEDLLDAIPRCFRDEWLVGAVVGRAVVVEVPVVDPLA